MESQIDTALSASLELWSVEVSQVVYSPKLCLILDIFLLHQLLTKIFSYMELPEWRAASAVCKRWLEILSAPAYTKNFPLVLSNCLAHPTAAPMSVFLNTPEDRSFPFVEITKLTPSVEHVSQYKTMMKRVGRHTTNLKLGSHSTEYTLSFFPDMKHLQLKKISYLQRYKPIPKSLESISVESLVATTDKKILKAKQIKSLTADCLYFDRSCKHPFFRLSTAFKKFIKDNAYFQGRFGTNVNLLRMQPIELSEVTMIHLRGNIEDYSALKELTNLEVNKRWTGAGLITILIFFCLF